MPPHLPPPEDVERPGLTYDDIPERVLRCVQLAAGLLHGAPRAIPWGATPGLLIAFWERFNGETRAACTDISPPVAGSGAFNPADVLRGMLAHPNPPMPKPRIFGLGVFAESVVFTDVDADPAALLIGTPEEINAQYADLVASGKIMQTRSVIAELVDGWRFDYSVPRLGDKTVFVYAPGEEWLVDAGGLVDALAEAVDKWVR